MASDLFSVSVTAMRTVPAGTSPIFCWRDMPVADQTKASGPSVTVLKFCPLAF